jgi:hypothetical protein
MRKIHLHAAPSVIAPPRRGPNKRAIPKTPETKLVYGANLAGGTNSKNITVVKEYVPAPAKP